VQCLKPAIPAIWEAEIGGDGGLRPVPGQEEGEFMRPHLNNKSWLWRCTCHPSYAGSISRRITVQASLDKNVRPSFKNT
jgi:hypothetical protein